MAASIVALRNAIYDSLVIAKASSAFVLNDWEIEESYLPVSSLPDLTTAGKLWILCGTFDTQKSKTRTNVAERNIQLQLGLQHKLETKADHILEDNCVTLQEQIRNHIRYSDWISTLGIQWMMDECLRDTGRVPFSYKGLREGNYFEQYFTVHFFAID